MEYAHDSKHYFTKPPTPRRDRDRIVIAIATFQNGGQAAMFDHVDGELPIILTFLNRRL